MSNDIAYVGKTSGNEFLNVTFREDEHNGKIVDFINIKVPGDNTLVIDLPVNSDYIKRFRRQYDIYKSAQKETGTPIADWPELTPGMIKEFAYHGFQHVEQIASAPDNAFLKVPGGMPWRAKARVFLDHGKIPADQVIKNQQEQINKLIKQMEALAPAKPKTGKKKEEDVAGLVNDFL